MEFLPDRLFNVLKRSAIPEPASGTLSTTPTTTTAATYKITHALDKLAQAGVVDDSGGQVISLGTTTSSIHAEKITHAANQLTHAGLASNGEAVKSTSKGLDTKYIIIIAVVGTVVLLTLLIGGCLCWRRYQRRKAYNLVSRGVDKGKAPIREKEDMFNADIQESRGLSVDGQMITERNFENAYDKVDTEYDGPRYGAVEGDGDKRARFEA
ncbi:hypothetical protein A1O3_03659 [Capronia epimyces CBS 606.96]|uniref:Mid2 domain-containing protein n=1 Tax=Capronia epimyces CBS 606.96 TaxID=1182542 RepID=W9YBR6_9EURO|nr:uncharacterized protein A1O3_03659 [Capronia epimyces CBS 606.96]EXJ86706.1 hypothetical protein A1O3_03659 [Capronia epimyces CBS 606.96]